MGNTNTKHGEDSSLLYGEPIAQSRLPHGKQVDHGEPFEQSWSLDRKKVKQGVVDGERQQSHSLELADLPDTPFERTPLQSTYADDSHRGKQRVSRYGAIDDNPEHQPPTSVPHGPSTRAKRDAVREKMRNHVMKLILFLFVPAVIFEIWCLSSFECDNESWGKDMRCDGDHDNVIFQIGAAGSAGTVLAAVSLLTANIIKFKNEVRSIEENDSALYPLDTEQHFQLESAIEQATPWWSFLTYNHNYQAAAAPQSDFSPGA